MNTSNIDQIPWIQTHQGNWVLNETTSNILNLLENNYQMECPLCQEHMHIMNMPIHMSEEHPITYQLWLYTMMPSFLFNDQQHENNNENNNENDNEIFTPQARALFSQWFQDIDTDTMSYDQLLNLCDSIGYHEVGYNNAQKELLCESCMDTNVDQYPRCAICLTEFSEMDSNIELARLKKCQHVFCQSCIYQWLDTHKKCPVCNQIQDDFLSIPTQTSTIESND